MQEDLLRSVRRLVLWASVLWTLAVAVLLPWIVTNVPRRDLLIPGLLPVGLALAGAVAGTLERRGLLTFSVVVLFVVYVSSLFSVGILNAPAVLGQMAIALGFYTDPPRRANS